MKKLNLGCGLDYREGWVNIDNNRKIKADVYSDLEKILPFKDDFFDYVYADNVLEHITNFIPLMGELKRICKNGAIIDIKVPHATCLNAFQDPTHIRFFNYGTFTYFEEKHFYDVPKFKLLKAKLVYSVHHKKLSYFINFFLNLYPRKYERLFGWIFPCEEVHFKLQVIK